MALLFFACFLRMRYVAAYLLAALAGNEAPQATDIQKILESVGIEADDTRMQKVWTYLSYRLATKYACMHMGIQYINLWTKPKCVVMVTTCVQWSL